MAIENGEWIMRGLDWDDPSRVQTWEELIELINEVGFLPLFKNEVDGFSVEENTADLYWWTGDEEQDPWEWRRLIARSGQVAYGKFFGRKAGFISKAWFPHFANWRRDGYDFDSRWDEELASIRCKRVMDQFENCQELFSFELKRLAGFGKEGEKNFDGTVTELQMQSYLLTRDFRRRINKKGLEYVGPSPSIPPRRPCGDMSICRSRRQPKSTVVWATRYRRNPFRQSRAPLKTSSRC